PTGDKPKARIAKEIEALQSVHTTASKVQTLRVTKGEGDPDFGRACDAMMAAIGRFAGVSGRDDIDLDVADVMIDPSAMIGARGTRVTSETVWIHGAYRIDVENPNPGKRAGQMHFQSQIPPKPKYQWDFKKNEFIGMPSALKSELAANFPAHLGGIVKGKKILGEP